MKGPLTNPWLIYDEFVNIEINLIPIPFPKFSRIYLAKQSNRKEWSEQRKEWTTTKYVKISEG